MRYAHWTIVAAMTAALAAGACNRARTDGPAREDTTAEQRQHQQDEAAQLERRAADLEREWNEMQARLEKETAEPTATLKAEVKEDVANVREAVDDLKTTTPENWWERHEQRMEQTANDVEQDVRRFARRWTAPETKTEVGTTGATGWEARRDRLVARLEARVDAMEEALKEVDLKGAPETEVEDTRARVRKLREDTDRMKKASADDWWDITRQRVADYIDRVDRSIDRLDNDQG